MGEIKIKAAYDAEFKLLRVSVTDSGKGIDPTDQDKLFKAFSKLPQAGSLNQEGVGMGLAICQRIIQNSGGQISVYSEGENKGSTFVFSMQMKKLDLNLKFIEEQRRPYKVQQFAIGACKSEKSYSSSDKDDEENSLRSNFD